MRSKLFVPGVRPELFAKAYAGAADAVSFDLEDAVAESRKSEARAAVAGFLAAQPAAAVGKLSIVRTNASDSAHFQADLDAIVPAAPDLLNIPKIESAEHVHAVVSMLERLERSLGLSPGARLLLNIETPRGLRHAADIATAHPRVAGLQLGLGDLFEPYGIDRGEPEHLRAVMFPLAMAAAEAGVFVCDGAYANLDDDAGFEREARMAQRLGFIGKSCIHPRQIALAHAVFSVDPQALALAREIVAAAGQAAQDSRAVFVVAGRMIDAPYLRRAQRLVEFADRRDPSPADPAA